MPWTLTFRTVTNQKTTRTVACFVQQKAERQVNPFSSPALKTNADMCPLQTTVYEKLDPLMLHIQSKHKTAMMTIETKEKTKTIVGGTPDRTEEWDINLPYTKPRSVPGGPVGEFVVSAVTGITKYQSTVNALG